MQGCVNTEQDIIERVESEVGSLAGSLAHADFIGPRVHAKIRNLIYWDLPKLVKETKKLRAENLRLQGIGVEYEYSVERTSLEYNDTHLWYDTWFPFEEARRRLDDLNAAEEENEKEEGFRYATYRMVKRRKAGKVETV